MTHSFTAYIDESGDEGFVFNPDGSGSRRWFILSACIVPRSLDTEPLSLARRIRSTIGLKSDAVIHFASIRNHEKRVALIDMIAQSPLVVTNVIINKQAIVQPEIFRGGAFRMYFYAARLLIERISWYCRDNRPPDDKFDGTVRLIFEHRKHLSYDKLRNYFSLLGYQAHEDAFYKMLIHDIRIDWNCIKEEKVEAATKAQFAGLQLADCCAGALREGLDLNPYRFTEHRYAKLLQAAVYCRNGNHRSYGLKFFPEPPNGPIRHWVDKYYR